MQDAVGGITLGQEPVVFGTGVGLVGVQLVFGAGQQFFQGLGVVFVSRGILNSLDEAVLIDVDVRLVAIGAGLLAVGGDLDVVPSLAVLGVLAILALAWAALLGRDDGGIDNADFASLDVQPLGRQLSLKLVWARFFQDMGCCSVFNKGLFYPFWGFGSCKGLIIILPR